MEVIECNTEVAIAMETIEEEPNLTEAKTKMAESRFTLSDAIVVDQLKLKAKNKSTAKIIQTWLNVWEIWGNERKFNPQLEEDEHEDLNEKLQMLNYLPKMDYSTNRRV